MQEAISQIFLPSILAFIMLAMGLSLSVVDFKRVAANPKSTGLGLLLQLGLLPLLAAFIAHAFSLPLMASIGLFLVALCPGGATSNLMSYLAKGNVALSVTLTAITSVIVPFTLPILLVGYMSYVGVSGEQFSMPLGVMIMKLFIVTILPVIVGMTIRHYWHEIALAVERRLKFVATFALLCIVVFLMGTNATIILNMLNVEGMAVLSLSMTSLFAAYFISRAIVKDRQNVKTIAIEVGVQNAGTAMMVALTLLKQPELVFVPLMYGILMNIPAFAFVLWSRKH